MKYKKNTLILIAALMLGLPAVTTAECSSEETTVGFVDGNAVSENCVQPAAMIETTPDPEVQNPTPSEEPNPNPNAGEDESGGEE